MQETYLVTLVLELTCIFIHCAILNGRGHVVNLKLRTLRSKSTPFPRTRSASAFLTSLDIPFSLKKQYGFHREYVLSCKNAHLKWSVCLKNSVSNKHCLPLWNEKCIFYREMNFFKGMLPIEKECVFLLKECCTLWKKIAPVSEKNVFWCILLKWFPVHRWKVCRVLGNDTAAFFGACPVLFKDVLQHTVPFMLYCGYFKTNFLILIV